MATIADLAYAFFGGEEGSSLSDVEYAQLLAWFEAGFGAADLLDLIEAWDSGGRPDPIEVQSPSRNVTAVKTGAYTAVSNDYVPVDTTGGAFAVSLPAAPVVGDTVEVKRVAGSNTGTIITQGAHVFNVAGGATTATLTLLNQHYTFVYAGANVWLVDTGNSLAQLDTRYLAATLVIPWQRYINITSYATPSVVSGTWTFTTGAFASGGYAASASSNNQSWTYSDLPTDSGTWAIDVIFRSSASSGIVTVTLGGAVVGTVDTYSAVGGNNNYGMLSGIVIGSAARRDLVLTNATKNILSGNYTMNIHAIVLRRTGA